MTKKDLCVVSPDTSLDDGETRTPAGEHHAELVLLRELPAHSLPQGYHARDLCRSLCCG